jgi:hypothetical protein
MNKQITRADRVLRGNQVLDGAGLIGRTVIAPGNNVYLPDADGDRARAAGPRSTCPRVASRAARGQGSSGALCARRR